MADPVGLEQAWTLKTEKPFAPDRNQNLDHPVPSRVTMLTEHSDISQAPHCT